MALDVRERGTTRTVTIEFNWPSLALWAAYQQACAEMFVVLSAAIPDMWLPDDVAAMQKDPQGWKVWAKTAAIALRSRPVLDRLVSIVDTYLDPCVDGKPADYDWFVSNVSPIHCAELLVMILCTDQMLEKKTVSALMMLFPQAIPQPSSSALPTTPTPASTRSSNGPTSRRLFS